MEEDLTLPSQVSVLAGALIGSACDKNATVQESVRGALTNLGEHQHAVVLGSLRNSLSNRKLDTSHRVVLLQCMNSILKATMAKTDINISLAREIIAMVSEDMTKSKKIVPDWQGACSDILVTVGSVFVNEVMENLLRKIMPGTLPHFFVVQTIGNLSVANVYGMVQYLKHLLTTFLPILGLVKHDNMRWVFSTCMGHFAEAILDYVMNIDKAPDPTITRDTFSNEISGAYQVLYSVWILTKETKVRCAVVDALGKMVVLLDDETLKGQGSNLTAMLISLYRRQASEPFPITKAISSVIMATTELDCNVLETNLESLTTVLHSQICDEAKDGTSPEGPRNYNEVLRCFGLLAIRYSDSLLHFLLLKLDSRDVKVRIGSLVVLRHLLNSASSDIEQKKDVVVIGLMKTLSETDDRAKKCLTKVISAMASHGFLLQEGGEKFVEFVVRQCACKASDIVESENSVHDANLQSMCDDVLYLFSTTIDGMHQVLWPYLFEFLKREDMTAAAGTISKCLAHIAKLKRESHAQDYMINFSGSVNVPSSFAILARLLVLLSYPTQSQILPIHILDLLVNIGPIIHHNLTDTWDAIIPEMKSFLRDAAGNGIWSQVAWEEKILQLLSSSVSAVSDEEWTCLLGAEMAEQWSLYQSLPHFKNVSFKCVGVLLRMSGNKEFVDVTLSCLLSSVQHSELVEREGSAICLGYAAFSHLDLAVSKLKEFISQQVHKKDSSFFGGFFKSDKAMLEAQLLHGTAGLCCGYIAYYAPPDLVLSRVDGVIVKMLLPLFKNVKDSKVRENLVYACELLASSVHPKHEVNHPIGLNESSESVHRSDVKKKRGIFQSRAQIINQLQTYMKEDGISGPTPVKAAIISAMTELVKLDPPLNDADLLQLLQITTKHVIGLPPVHETDKENQSTVPQKLIQEQCNVGLFSLLREIILKSPTPERLDFVFKNLQSWISSEYPHERGRGLHMASKVFDTYLNAFVVTKTNTSLNAMGTLISCTLTRCCDPEPDIRLEAVHCVEQLLKIQNKCNGAANVRDETVEMLSVLGGKLKSSNPEKMNQHMEEIVKIVMKQIPNEWTYFTDGSLTTSLMSCLLSPQQSCANGACIALHHIFKSRGAGFSKQVIQLVEAILNTLKNVMDGTARAGVLKLICLLAAHHTQAVLTALLKYPIPYTEHVVACWRALGAGSHLREPTTEHLLDLLSRGVPYDEKHKGFVKKSKEFSRTATIQLIAASCGLREVLEACSNAENTDILPKGNGGFCRSVAVCLIRVGSMRGVGPPNKIEMNPFRQAIDVLYCLIVAICARDFCQLLEEKLFWNNLESEDENEFFAAIATFASGLCRYRSDDITDIVTFLNPFMSSVYTPQRVTVSAFFAQLVAEYPAQNEILLEVLVNSIRSHLVDQSNVVRRLCIRGLGNIVLTSQEQVKRYGASILSAMMAGMEDKHDGDDSIVLESMHALERYLLEVVNTNIHSILVNICLRVRSCFEKDNSEVRSTSIRLFGSLAQCATGPSENAFVEQVYNNLVPLLLHLNDDEMDVRNASKNTLCKVQGRLGSETVNEVFEKRLHCKAEIHYGEFMNELSKILVRDMPDKINLCLMGCVSFYKSHWHSIRSNAAMFTGFLMSNVHEEKRHGIASEQICAALIQLLNDSSPEVRGKAAEAMSVLHQY